jgi:light-regulated signal transduction histidine kinase (bacteriophytochrome)
LPVVDGNYDALLRVFQNLIGNAIQYRSANPPKVRVSARMRGGDWIFAVEDNGTGIDMRYAYRIFEAFRRLHSRDEIEGSGIGLALSQPGKGLTFFSTLPRRVELAVSSAAD